MSTFNEREVKAVRKARTCDWCGQPINTGEPAHYSAGFDDEILGFWTSYMHPECEVAFSMFHARQDIEDDGWEYQGMQRGSSATLEELADERRAAREAEADHA